MDSLARQEFEQKYYNGKLAFERGQYRLSIEQFEQACQLMPFNTRLGGEARMWLVNAYEAFDKPVLAISLCQELCKHPHQETKKQAQNLLYIIKAPRLKRPKEWMTEIPDLNGNQTSKIKPQANKSSQRKIEPKRQIELIDLSKVNNKDNQFILLGLLLSIAVITGLFLS
jgi:hypothetical protein